MRISPTIITVTRNRPDHFRRLETLISRQTLQPLRWLVVNDGTIPYTYNRGQDVILRDPSNDKLHSIVENYACAVGNILPTDKKLIIIEHDDVYFARYLEVYSGLLDTHQLVGTRNNRYVNLKYHRIAELGNLTYSSLATTGITSDLLPMFAECLKADPFIDLHLWARRDELKWTLQPDNSLQVGVKDGSGYGVGHTPKYGQEDTEDRARDWLGEWYPVLLQAAEAGAAEDVHLTPRQMARRSKVTRATR